MDEEEKLKVMGLLEHVSELRTRLVKSILTLLVFFFICYAYAPEILSYLKQPLVGVLPQGANSLYFTGPMDVFMAQVKIGFFSALVLSCPVWIFQLWRFIEPALYEKERKYAAPFLISAIGLFVVGISFCFYVIIPNALGYLIGLGTEMGATAIITIQDYLSLIMLLMVGFGAIFETPVILILLAMLDVITADTLRSNRKIVVVIIFIIAALLTPTPDPISQMAMALPTYLMYEMSIVIIAYLQSRKDRKEKKESSTHKG